MAFCKLTHPNETKDVDPSQAPSVAFQWNTAYNFLDLSDPMLTLTKNGFVQWTTNTLQSHMKNIHPRLELSASILTKSQLEEAHQD